jgi:Na+-transporting NADH:ubiquinone oxidoreductase subunit NqrA
VPASIATPVTVILRGNKRKLQKIIPNGQTTINKTIHKTNNNINKKNKKTIKPKKYDS